MNLGVFNRVNLKVKQSFNNENFFIFNTFFFFFLIGSPGRNVFRMGLLEQFDPTWIGRESERAGEILGWCGSRRGPVGGASIGSESRHHASCGAQSPEHRSRGAMVHGGDLLWTVAAAVGTWHRQRLRKRLLRVAVGSLLVTQDLRAKANIGGCQFLREKDHWPLSQSLRAT